ncbi:MAG: hypothetical protein ACK5QO_12290, partial [Hyphomonadaceae bacterium]
SLFDQGLDVSKARWVRGEPLHRLRRSFPMNGEAATEAVETRRFPVYVTSAKVVAVLSNYDSLIWD